MKTPKLNTLLAGLAIGCLVPTLQLTVRADDVETPPPSIRNPGNPLTEKQASENNIARNPGQLSASDYKFAYDAAQGGMTEVKLGEIASQKATDPEVKKFGDRMVQDHGKAGEELKQIATQKGATLPTQPNAMQQKHIDHLNSLSGAEFDQAYVSMMLKDHKMDAMDFKTAAETAQDPDLKAFAAKTAPVVEEHKHLVQDLDKNLNAK